MGTDIRGDAMDLALLERIRKGEIDPTFIITHRMKLADAPRGYEMFVNKEDHCEKVVLSAA